MTVKKAASLESEGKVHLSPFVPLVGYPAVALKTVTFSISHSIDPSWQTRVQTPGTSEGHASMSSDDSMVA